MSFSAYAQGGTSSGSRPYDKSDMDEDAAALFEELRKLRHEIAREENVPPYIVFNDRTLIGMAVQKPASREEMNAVSGVGLMKLQKYGDRFLKEIEAYQRKHGLQKEEKQAQEEQQADRVSLCRE